MLIIHVVLFDDASIVEADFFWQLNIHEKSTCLRFLEVLRFESTMAAYRFVDFP